MRQYVRAPKEAAALPRALRGTDTFVDLIWIAAEQLAYSAASHVSRLKHASTTPASFYLFGDEPEETEAAVKAVTSLVNKGRDEGINDLIVAMSEIAGGDRDVARAYDSLFARVALLAESSSSNTLLQY